MTFVVVIWTLIVQPTPTSTGRLDKLCPPSQPLLDLMELSMWISLSSRPTWCPTPGSTSPWSPMLPSSLLRRPTMSSSVWLKSLMHALSQLTRWSSVILVMASTWLAACSTGEMLCPRMSMLQLPPSRPREPSSLLTGAPLDSRLESTTSLQLWFQEETWPRYRGQCACCPTLLPLLRLGPDLTTSLT